MGVFRLGELFCGPGGIACGAHRACSQDGSLSIKHAWASDFDPDTCHTYAYNICGGDSSTVYCKDVRKLDLSKLGPIDAALRYSVCTGRCGFLPRTSPA